jgi:hypothetical protein
MQQLVSNAWESRFTQQIESILDITGPPQFTLSSTLKGSFRSVSKELPERMPSHPKSSWPLHKRSIGCSF